MKLCQRVVATLHCQLSRWEHFYPVFPDITHISSSVVPAPLLGLGKGTRSKLLSTKKRVWDNWYFCIVPTYCEKICGRLPCSQCWFLSPGSASAFSLILTVRVCQPLHRLPCLAAKYGPAKQAHKVTRVLTCQWHFKCTQEFILVTFRSYSTLTRQNITISHA